MAQITYNGVTLPYCYISQFAQRIVYDEVGGVDAYCTEFDIQAQCVIHYYYLSQLISSWNTNPPVATDPATIMYAVRQQLKVPRKRLSVQVNGVELIPNYQNKSPVDAQNGPTPKFVDIIQMPNGSFLISFSILAKYFENIPANTTTNFSTSNAKGSPVLYNRWGEGLDIDDCNNSVRTRTGKFIIRSDNPDGFIADQLRAQFACVSIPNGFLRESAKYKVDPNGLGLEYTLVDREVYNKPPSPAFKASGYYMESSTKMGAIRRGVCQIKLWGSNDTDQGQLVTTGVNVCMARLGVRGNQLAAGGQLAGGATNFRIIDEASVRVELYENIVECNISAWVGATPNRVSGVAAFIPFVTFVPYSTANYVPNYKVYGTAGYLLQAAAYYDPSIKMSGLMASKIGAVNNQLVTVGNVNNQNTGVQVGQLAQLGE